MDTTESIFISLNGFNDKELMETVDSAFYNAEHPERIYVGVYEQRTDNNFADFSNYRNVRHVKVYTEDLLGTGLARLNAYYLNSGETFCLAVDAHTLFDYAWDSYLVAYIKDLEKFSEKTIISYRIPDWRRGDNNEIIKDDSPFSRSTLAPVVSHHEKGIYIPEYTSAVIKDVPYEKSQVFDNEKYFTETELDRRIHGYVEHFMLSGNFIFARQSFFAECVWDPEVFFYGEEEVMSLRAVSRGYRIFVPNENYFYHKGKDHKPDSRVERDIVNHEDGELSWGSLTNQRGERYRGSQIKINIGMNTRNSRIYRVLTGQEYGYWGAPSPEALAYFEEKINFSYKEVLTHVNEENYA